MVAALKGIWEALSHDPGVVATLLVAVLVLLYSHVHVHMAYRGRLKDKDDHIRDLIQERNRLQQHILNQHGLSRMTSSQEGL